MRNKQGQFIKTTGKIKGNCLRCGREFEAYPSRNKRFCSHSCQFKGKWTEEHKKNHKLSFQKYKGKDNWNWAGDNVGYKGLHSWLIRNYPKPYTCEHCGKDEGKIEWANKNGNYVREREEWLLLCGSCHSKYDGIIYNIKKMNKTKL
jgi:hypothetical protein